MSKVDYIEGTTIPIYTLKQLKKTHNVLVNRKHVVKYGEEELKKIYLEHGYHVKLLIIKYSESKVKYPTDATYVIEKI